MFEQLKTLDDVRQFIGEARRASTNPQSRWQVLNPNPRPLGFGFEYGQLPLAVAEPGPLIEHVVTLAGEDGMTAQQLRSVFEDVGHERYQRGLKQARACGRLVEATEKRPNREGHPQAQLVLRAKTSSGQGGF